MHAHMISRTTDDYHQMALTGCLAVTEPAFWSGRDRLGAQAFADYFDHLTTFEPARAAQYGIAHYAWLCLNPKEGEDRELARQVLALIPDFLARPTVLGIGEIGLNRVTRNELATFLDHVELALEHRQLIHIHTPHLEDKYKGTKVIVETLLGDSRIDPARVMVDHAEEHTVPMILENGFWTGFTLYPRTKASPARAIDMIEVYGPESSGKTTLALHTVAEGQKKGGICAFIDAEHALDPVYARKLGVNIDELLISQPDTGEQALEICDTLVRSGAVDVLVIDSVAALVPKAELEGEMGDALPGLQARLMSQALRKLTASINKSNTMVIFINQIRMKIGVMYGSPETTTGGNALKFYASVRLDIRRIGAIKERDEVVGNTTRVKVVKNKLAPPFKQVEFDIMYGEGVSKMGEILDLGVKAGLVEKSGAWFSYDSQRLGQGRENSKAFLRANPDITTKIEAAIRQNSGLISEQILAGTPERDADGEEPTEE